MSGGPTCGCGCGQDPGVWEKSAPSRGIYKGEPKRFIAGHNQRLRTDPSTRFPLYVDTSGECHVWTGHLSRGYGQFFPEPGKPIGAHRWAMQQALGRQLRPDEFVLHSCDNPPCVNLAHLRVGTHEDNMRDAVSRRRFNRNHASARKTHCKNGHPFTPENTYRRPDADTRDCRTCRSEAHRRYVERRRGEVA